jgi:hypothetical protein
MACGRPRPRGAASDVGYGLRRCDGFRVDSPEGRVGVVEEVRYASRCDRPDAIAVRAGLLGRLLLLVPVAEVAWIPPARERVVLHRSPRATATERPQDLRGRVQARGGRRAGRGPKASEPEPSAPKAKREVEAVFTRLTRRVGLRLGRGGEEKVTPDVEESAEPSAEEPAAEGQAGEERAAEEAPAEGAAEAAAAEEPAPEEVAAEEPPAEEQTTA